MDMMKKAGTIVFRDNGEITLILSGSFSENQATYWGLQAEEVEFHFGGRVELVHNSKRVHASPDADIPMRATPVDFPGSWDAWKGYKDKYDKK